MNTKFIIKQKVCKCSSMLLIKLLKTKCVIFQLKLNLFSRSKLKFNIL